MEGLQTNASMYADNAMIVASQVNQYVELGSAKSSPSRKGQSEGGLGYIPQVTPFLTIS